MNTTEVPSTMPSTGWMKRAHCADEAPETFFPSDGVGVLRAQKICARCPVLEDCLEYALANHISHGVWGGASERQRRRLQHTRQLDRHQRQIAEKAVAVA